MDFHLVFTLLIIIIGVLFSYFANSKSLKSKKLYLFVVTLLLVLESGMRGLSVGDDTLTYFEIFESIKNTSWTEVTSDFQFFSNKSYEDRNQGYNIFQWLFQLFSDNFRVYLFFIAIVFFASLYDFLLRNTVDLSELILGFSIYCALFYYFFSITGIKQTLTSSIALFSIRFVQERRIVFFVITILFASILHKSVLVFLPFYFLPWFGKVKLNYLFALFFFFVIFINRDNVVTGIISDTVFDSYLSDLEGRGTLGFTSLFLFVVLLSYTTIEKMAKRYPEYTIYYNAMLMAMILVPLTWVNSNAMRVVQYYSIYMIVFIPKIINVGFHYNAFFKRFTYFICIVVLLSFVVRSRNSKYTFFWEENGVYRDR